MGDCTIPRYPGGEGTNVTVSGSVWDHSWHNNWKDAWIIRDGYGTEGDGTDLTYRAGTTVTFDDATIVLGEDAPLMIDVPSAIRVNVSEEVTFTVDIYDYDGDIHNLLMLPTTEYDRLDRSYPDTQTGGASGERVVEILTYDPWDEMAYYTNRDGQFVLGVMPEELTELALGEVRYQTIEITFNHTPNTWDHTRSWDDVTAEVTIEIVGENDRPEWLGDAASSPLEGPGFAMRDLASLADDPDSDDDGTSLSYEIVSISPGFDALIEGTQLSVTRAQGSEWLYADEAATGEVTLRATDRHGAATNDLAVEFAIYGEDRPLDVHVAATEFDYAGAGIDPAATADYGVLYNIYLTDEAL